MSDVEVPLRRRDGTVRAFALVDAADAERVLAHRWHVATKGYAIRNVPGRHRRSEFLHRFLMGLEHGDPREVDHRNHDKLDCRRANLRVTTRAQNQQNRRRGYGTSNYRGVSWHVASGHWRARAKLNGREVYLGIFSSEEGAARAAAAFRAEHMPYSSDAAA